METVSYVPLTPDLKIGRRRKQNVNTVITPKNLFDQIASKLREITDFSHVFATPYDPKTAKPMIDNSMNVVKERLKTIVKDEFMPKMNAAINNQANP